MRLALDRIAANLANVVVNVLIFTESIKSCLIKRRVDFFHRVGEHETAQSSILTFAFRLFDHLRIHAGELFRFASDRFLKILLISLDPTGYP